MKRLIIAAMLAAAPLAHGYQVVQDVDIRQPIYAREDALLCDSRESLLLGLNAKSRGWHYTPTIGINPPKPIKAWAKIEPGDVGCKLLPDGRPLVFIGDQFRYIETTDGLTIRQMIRN